MSRALGYIAFGGADQQRYLDRPAPVPGPAEVAIRVAAAGVNPLDVALREGALPALNGAIPFPQVLGMEASGTVTAVGSAVEGLAVGDRVLGFALTGAGTYAEDTLLLGAATARVPDGLPDTWAAVVPVAGTTALDVLDQLDLAAGSVLLVNGVGGGVGIATAQLAAARGLRVIGTAGPAKRSLVESVGAVFVDRREPDLPAVLRGLAPAGFDGIVDTVGGASLRAVAPSAPAAAVVSVGDPAVAELGGAQVVRRIGRPTLERVAALMLEGVLDPRITSVHPLSTASAALAAVESGHATGKLVIDLTAER